MDFTQEDMDAAKQLLSNSIAEYAPYEVFAAMLHLQGDVAAVVAGVADSESKEGRTTWRATWLTDSCLLFCEASADLADWELASGRPYGSYEAQVDAWTAPLREITSVGVDSARMVHEFGTWSADAHVTVHVKDRAAFAVPLFAEWPRPRLREAGETFLCELLSRLN